MMGSAGGSIDPRTPVIVGVGQIDVPADAADPGIEPVELIAEAVSAAFADSGGRGLAAAIESVRVVRLLSWRYRDPGSLIAERLGASPAQTAVSPMGGNSPQALVNLTATEIAEGRLGAAVICGGETWRTRQAVRRSGGELSWSSQDESVPAARLLGEEFEMNHPTELERGIITPVQVYPLFETALRAVEGHDPAEHLERISRLWAGFARVAKENPYAAVRHGPDEVAIRTPSPQNRWIGHPYTKWLVSNERVDQAAALVLCSAEVAASLAVPRDRWVFPLAGSEAAEPQVSLRHELHRSPAISAAGSLLFELAGIGVDALAHIDLYSCFPSAVQIAARELGLDLDRDLTVTGGLTFAGGPWNNYVTHAIATMAGVLREDPTSIGLCTANGGFISKHSLGLYSCEPPAAGFRSASAQGEADKAPRREVLASYDGPVTIEGCTVMHRRDGTPEVAFAACLTDEGQRTWAASHDPDLMDVLMREERCGHVARTEAGTLLL